MNAINATVSVLWPFTFIGGGFNQVWATCKSEAKTRAKLEFSGCAHEIDFKSFRALRSKKAQDAYWKSLPLMD